MLFCPPEDDVAETGEPFSGLKLGGDVPKPFFDRGGRGCRIISVVYGPSAGRLAFTS